MSQSIDFVPEKLSLKLNIFKKNKKKQFMLNKFAFFSCKSIEIDWK